MGLGLRIGFRVYRYLICKRLSKIHIYIFFLFIYLCIFVYLFIFIGCRVSDLVLVGGEVQGVGFRVFQESLVFKPTKWFDRVLGSYWHWGL